MNVNKNQVVIVWVLGAAFLHVLDVLPGLAYILLIAPPILYHAWASTPTATSVEEMEHANSHSELENDEVTVDTEYTERIELQIGGYVELDCWKEVPFDEADEEDKKRTCNHSDRMRVEG